MDRWLVFAAAVLAFALGAVHLLFTFRGRRFDPRDADTKQRMQQTTPRITTRTSFWNASIGFHASHSLGAMLFGAVYAQLALVQGPVLAASRSLAATGVVYLACMTWLAWRHWFRIPLVGLALALAMYVAGWLLALAR